MSTKKAISGGKVLLYWSAILQDDVYLSNPSRQQTRESGVELFTSRVENVQRQGENDEGGKKEAKGKTVVFIGLVLGFLVQFIANGSSRKCQQTEIVKEHNLA